VSEETAEAIDEEVRALVEGGKKHAHEILIQNRAILDSLAVALLERETIDEEEVSLLIAGSPLPSSSARQDDRTATEASSAAAAAGMPTKSAGESPTS
jgi:cell division protease FtsH